MISDIVIEGGEFFAGGGGVTEGVYNNPNLKIQWVLNHDPIAIKVNRFHHKGVDCLEADVYLQDEKKLKPVDFIWASVACQPHSQAYSKGTVDPSVYMLAWELYRYLVYLKPLTIGIENVPKFKNWAPIDEENRIIKERKGEEFEKWKKAIMDLGYKYTECIREAADDGHPTRRKRYFAFFYRDGIEFEWPESTHSRHGKKGKKKWLPCRPYINLEDEGESIFGREFNSNLPKHLRKPYVKNSLARIAGGVKKFAGDYLQFICSYYGKAQQQSLEDPLATVRCGDCHQLITMSEKIQAEKIQFIIDHCHTTNYQTADDPLRPVLTWQTKQLATVKTNWISHMQNSNGNPGANVHSLDEPVWGITREQKIQFFTAFFNSSGKPGTQVYSLDQPLTAVLAGSNKHQLVTILDGFDIKARFLTPEELGQCMTFPKDYFSSKELKLSKKNACKLIGNAVPPEWAGQIIAPVIEGIIKYKMKLQQQSKSA